MQACDWSWSTKGMHWTCLDREALGQSGERPANAAPPLSQSAAAAELRFFVMNVVMHIPACTRRTLPAISGAS